MGLALRGECWACCAEFLLLLGFPLARDRARKPRAKAQARQTWLTHIR